MPEDSGSNWVWKLCGLHLMRMASDSLGNSRHEKTNACNYLPNGTYYISDILHFLFAGFSLERYVYTAIYLKGVCQV